MRLTAKSEYGLLALIDVARNEDAGPVSARAIAERQHIPLKFLEQLLVQLRKAGLVSAIRGAHGGFVLGRGAGDIRVLDIVEVLEGPLQPTVCQADDCLRHGSCAASGVWAEATRALRDVFGAKDLATLAREQVAMDRPGA